MGISPEQKRFTTSDIWERLGITEHLGGIYATRRLIELCNIKPGQYVLDIGCGTGYTACLLAKEYQVEVVAADINPKVLEDARKRIAEEGVSDKVTVIEADAQELPFPADTFDAAIAESVLVFCDQEKVASEVYRVLRPGGVFGDNEATYLKHPPEQLLNLLSESGFFGVNIRALPKDQWQLVFREAGFSDVSSTVYEKFSFGEQFLSHLRVDGVRKYLSALSQSIFDPNIRATFFNKDMIGKMREYSSYVNCGLFVCRKV